MFRSFGIFNYRIWFVGALVSNVGQWMQATAQSWVVLTVLTSQNATAVGITMALQFAPPLLLVPFTGWVVDRFDRRYVLYCTQTALLLLAMALGLLLITDVAELWHVFLLAGLLGIVSAFDNPARQTFVTDLVSVENASNAVALNSASFNMARMLGPAVAGFMIVLTGPGWVFIVNAGTFLAMLLAIRMIRTADLAPQPRQRTGTKLTEGFRYARRRTDLLIVFGIVFLVAAFGMNFPIIASTMALEFGRDADGFGVLSTVMAIGSLAGALIAASRAQARIRVVIAAAGLFAVASFVSAAMPGYLSYAISLVAIGFAAVTLMTTANAVVQTTTDAVVRGRVMAIYMAILMGGTPVGAPVIGWIADAWGPRAAIVVGGIAAAIGCLGGLSWLIVSGRLHRAPQGRGLVITETRMVPVVQSTDFSDEIAMTTPIPLMQLLEDDEEEDESGEKPDEAGDEDRSGDTGDAPSDPEQPGDPEQLDAP